MATVPKRTATIKRPPAKKPGTADSFQNFAAKLGIGTPNLSSYSNYGLNPVTRQRAELDFIYRGSWLIGVAVDCVAEDMTVEGVEFTGDLPPEEQAVLGSALVDLNFWGEISSTIKWARLYGGAIAVMLIDGQDVETPLDVETIGEGQFKGFYVFDRWMITPEYNAVVTEVGPEIGKPLWYKPNAQTGVYQGKKIHYTRVLRVDGIELPYFQRIAENGWGLSIVERIWDRLVSFDSATAGAGQLVFKAYLRTLKVKGLRKILAAGGTAELSLTKQVENIRALQATEGLTMVDSEDDFNTHSYSFAGLSDIIIQFGQQVSGALQVPLVRLFGQSPAGLNSSGDSDWRNYSTGIKREQNARLRAPLGRAFQVLYRSTFNKPPPDNFNFNFLDLWKLSHAEKADVATKTTASVLAGYDAGLVSAQVALRELRQSGHETGVWTNITDDDIDVADSEPPAPQDEPPTPGGAGGGSEAPKDLVDTVDAFKEEEHPRDPDGEFTAGGGSSSSKIKSPYKAEPEFYHLVESFNEIHKNEPTKVKELREILLGNSKQKLSEIKAYINKNERSDEVVSGAQAKAQEKEDQAWGAHLKRMEKGKDKANAIRKALVDAAVDGKVQFFHGTSAQAISSIKEHGLVPGKGQGGDAWAEKAGLKPSDFQKLNTHGREMSAYMATDMTAAKYYANLVSKGAGVAPVMLKITIPTDQLDKLHVDEYGGNKQSVRYEGSIPPEWIEEVPTKKSGTRDSKDSTIYVVVLATDPDYNDETEDKEPRI